MTLSLYWLFFVIVSIWSFSDFCWILLPPVQSYFSPLLPAADPFLPGQSVGFQVPFNKVLTTALSAWDNKSPLPAKTIRAEQSGRDEKDARSLTAAGLLPCTAASAELGSGLPFVQTTPQVWHGGEQSCERGCATPTLCRCIKARLRRLKTLSLWHKAFFQRYFLSFISYQYGAGEELGKSLNPEYNEIDEYLT